MSAIDWIEREDGSESFVKDLKVTLRDGKFIIIFHEFDKSKYANGEYFNEYSKHIRYKDDLSDTVKELFEDIEIPTQEDWCDLQLNIENHGLGNSYRQAVAP